MFLIMWNNNIVIIFQGNWPAEKTCAIKLPVTNKNLMKLGNSAVWKTAFKIMWFQDRKHSVLAVNVLSCDMSEDTARRPSHAVVPNLLMFFSKCDIHSSCSPAAPAPPHTTTPPPLPRPLSSCLSREACEVATFGTERSAFRAVSRLACKLDYERQSLSKPTICGQSLFHKKYLRLWRVKLLTK